VVSQATPSPALLLLHAWLVGYDGGVRDWHDSCGYDGGVRSWHSYGGPVGFAASTAAAASEARLRRRGEVEERLDDGTGALTAA
jgi:hypothetical protein